MNIEILDTLINTGENLTSTISYVPPGRNVIRTFSVFKTNEPVQYQNWQSSAQRFIKTNFPSDLEEIKEASKKISPENHRKILGILSAIKLLPFEPETLRKYPNPTNNINITTNQNNSQQVTLNVFLDAVKDEITGKEMKALKEILKEYELDPQKNKSKLTNKIKSFGSDVLTNILANIITSPSVYS